MSYRLDIFILNIIYTWAVKNEEEKIEMRMKMNMMNLKNKDKFKGR